MMKEACPICHSPRAEMTLIGAGSHSEKCACPERCECPDCGCYVIPRVSVSWIRSVTENDRILGHKCAAVMLERNLKGLNEDIQLGYDGSKSLYFANTGERLEEHYPTTFHEKLERGFFNLVRSLRHSPLVRFSINELQHCERSLLFVGDTLENCNDVLECICEEGWLRRYEGTTDDGTQYKVTTKGMQLFDAASVNNPSNAFLAMWFGADEEGKYRDSVKQAVENAGYHLHVVDDEHYNGFIMDKVTNLINDSAFVIADITAAPERICDNGVVQGVRGGVYWEAGYAKGQEKQVILTCRDYNDTMKRIHFDLQQYNQIRWYVQDGRIVASGGHDFVDILTQRILATVGRGSRRHEIAT